MAILVRVPQNSIVILSTFSVPCTFQPSALHLVLLFWTFTLPVHTSTLSLDVGLVLDNGMCTD